ncbi:PA0069 family radical SAM protein [Humitalea sp. 24SJ18S-53]|uniref:PA0069 family radical SAM protein n=1 Tax=Humitalea sp. 24SJ18S-53 TaxID=3422307 RepID=UPI003D67B9EE
MPDGSLHGPSLASIGARKGRGALSNPANRYERQSTVAWDDGWGTLDAAFAAPEPLATTLTRDSSRSAMAWNTSPDIGFDRSINMYRGCEHGCIYCFARPSHAHLGLSPGLDFETRLLFKPDIAALLTKEIRKPGYVAKPVALGANTDPYQPVERTLGLTRQILEVLDAHNHPVTIVTKSAGVTRDLDILSRMAQRNLVHVCLSITTLDPALARVMEPRAASPTRRLAAIGELSRAGIPTGILAAPMIPGLNDPELEHLIDAAVRHGATRAGYVLLRLPLEIAQMFEAWLHQHFPDRAAKVLSLIRQTRGGELYDSRFGKRQSGTGPYADLLASRFALALRKHGLDRASVRHQSLDCDAFRVPAAAVPQPAQMALF